MIRFIRKAAKAVFGFVSTIAGTPLVTALLSDHPINWKVTLATGAVVGFTVYLTPNKGKDDHEKTAL